MHIQGITRSYHIHKMKKKLHSSPFVLTFTLGLCPLDLSTKATYMRLIDKIFKEHISELMEVYINDMLVRPQK